MVAAWHGGLKPGLLATALGGVAGVCLFIELDGCPFAHASNGVRIGMFLAAGALVSAFNEFMHHARRRAKQLRELLAGMPVVGH